LSDVHIEGRQIITFIHCFINETDLWEFIDAGRAHGEHIPVVTKKVLQEDRQCPKWHQYTPGFSPQQHLEEERALELELKRQQFEQRMDKENKEFTVRLDVRNRRFQFWLAVVLGIFAIAEVLAAFVQVAFPNGWPWLMHKVGADVVPSIPPIPGM
jgi:hypothetical protein